MIFPIQLERTKFKGEDGTAANKKISGGLKVLSPNEFTLEIYNL